MLEDLIAERRKKLDAFKNAGIDPYPARVRRTCEIGEARAKFAAFAKAKKKLSLAGRVMSIRDQGSIAFIDIRDESGSIQAVLKEENLKNLAFWESNLDRGDFISVTGSLFTTKRGEKSIEVNSLALISKSLRPLPSKWHGIADVELRLRERYLDILFNSETAELFRKKALFWGAVRSFLLKEGFLEVETSVFEAVPGGAEAEPFITHHHALDADFYLRISLELPLKKLLAGGFEKVFEIGRIFRNEGIDHEHLQDYTQCEFYWAYRDYRDLMVFVERMYKDAIKRTTGGLRTTAGGVAIDWNTEWKHIDYVDAFREATGIDPLAATKEELARYAKSAKIETERTAGLGRLIDQIFKKTARQKLVQPCVLVDPPVAIEPLAKRLEKDPRRVERFQIVAGGVELGKGFSELNDPLDQRARFEEQMKLRAAGDKEAQRIDEEFLRAMEYGFPPIAGFGLSERLFAFLMDKPIRETVLYPLMKPRKEENPKHQVPKL